MYTNIEKTFQADKGQTYYERVALVTFCDNVCVNNHDHGHSHHINL